MVRLASIEFTKLKNVRAGTRLTFSEAGAVLLGRNGTGKTTLLHYLVALCTADTSAFVSDEPFDVSATCRLGTAANATLRLEGAPSSTPPSSRKDSSIIAQYLAQYLPTSENTKVSLSITLPDEGINYLIAIEDGRAELSSNGKPLGLPIYITNHQIQLFGCIWKLAELMTETKNLPRRTISSFAIELDRLRGALYRYDEGLDYFRLLTDENSTYLTFDIIASNKTEQSSPEIRGSIHRLPLATALLGNWRATSELEYFSVKDTEVEFLAEFVRLCQFSGAMIIAPIETRRVARDGIHHECKSLRFTFDLGRDRISHAKLSFGQKRLLSYLYYLACNTDIGIADGLVNGMHHEWIEYCLETACAGRQMFYTSQNPLLLDFLTFQSEAEVSERFVTCKWSEQDGFVWENLDPRIGQEFYRLYQTGIQHVSDILRTKNWW